MKRILALIIATAAGLVLVSAQGAAATETTGPSFATCDNLSGWFVNPDETDRVPTATKDGLEFSGDELVHHNVSGLSTDDLKPGTFAASPAPDQDSFFSVEVYGADGGYATLRWNTTTDKWNMTTGGQFYENADPSDLVEMVTPAKSKTVVRFGVGYTKNPPGEVTTTVSAVTFNGHTYDLTCKPPVETISPTPSASVSSSASPSASASASASASPAASGEGGSLPITGPSGWAIAAFGIGVIVAGAIALLLARRRKVNFRA